MSLKELSIIIVNWNSKDYLKQCIASILASTTSLDVEIIVVDSASFDGCGEMLKEYYPHVHFIQSETNVGFAKANNIGANQAKGKVLLFLNPDTEVKNNAIDELYRYHHQLKNAGVVGCRLLNSDGTLQTSCVQPFPTVINQVLDMDFCLRKFAHSKLWMSAITFEASVVPVSVEVISGACMMIGKAVFDQVEKFSNDYFMYAEDLDLCFKTKMSGFTNYYLRNVEVVHHGGGSTHKAKSSFSTVMMHESIFRFLSKAHGAIYGFGYRTAMIITAILRLILLIAYLPVGLVCQKLTDWQNSFNKWQVILRWGLGFERWTLDYWQS